MSDNKKIFEHLKHDFKAAKKAKVEIDNEITVWTDAYEGIARDKYGEVIKSPDGSKRSKIIMREIAKHVELQKPNLIQPFVATTNPIHVIYPKSEERARQISKWLNYQFTVELDRQAVLDDAVDVFLREGTVWFATSWISDKIMSTETIKNQDLETIASNPEAPIMLEENPDGTYDASYEIEVVNINKPDIEVVENENVFPDPSARKLEDMTFLCREMKMTINDLKDIPGLSQENINSLELKIEKAGTDSALGNDRRFSNEKYGRDTNEYQALDTARKAIKVIQYWGYYDLDNDGKAEPILAYWAKDEDKFLGAIPSPMPHGKIPFHNAVYSKRAFTLWGNAPAYFILDNQRAKTGVMRGIFDNMSLANNNQKFITRGALDYVNYKKMVEGARHITVNRPDSIQDGSFNNLPASVFNVMQMLDKENVDLMGVNPSGPALDGGTISGDSQNQMLTMSQQKMIQSLGIVSNAFKGCFTDWVSMGKEFLEDEQILELFAEEELKDVNAFAIANGVKVSMKVATEATRNIKLHQLNMLMQQAKTLESSAPEGLINEIVAEMYDNFDMHEKATKLRLYKREPSPEEQMMQQLQMQKAQLEVEELKEKVRLMEQETQAKLVNAQARMIEAQASSEEKYAKADHASAKAQGERVKTALDPVKVESEIGEREQAMMQNLTEKDVEGETKQRN